MLYKRGLSRNGCILYNCMETFFHIFRNQLYILTSHSQRDLFTRFYFLIRIKKSRLCTDSDPGSVVFHRFHDSSQDICIAHKRSHITGLRMIIDLIWCADLLELALIHHHDPIRHIDGFFLVMGDIDKGDPKLLLQAFQFQLHGPAKLQIQRSKGFIQKQDSRIIGKGSGDCHTLFLTAGQFRGLSLLVAFQLDQFQHFFYFFVYFFFRDFSYFQTVSDIVLYVHMRKQCVVLKNGVYVSLIGL